VKRVSLPDSGGYFLAKFREGEVRAMCGAFVVRELAPVAV
jgi:hypothetical protein